LERLIDRQICAAMLITCRLFPLIAAMLLTSADARATTSRPVGNSVLGRQLMAHCNRFLITSETPSEAPRFVNGGGGEPTALVQRAFGSPLRGNGVRPAMFMPRPTRSTEVLLLVYSGGLVNKISHIMSTYA